MNDAAPRPPRLPEPRDDAGRARHEADEAAPPPVPSPAPPRFRPLGPAAVDAVQRFEASALEAGAGAVGLPLAAPEVGFAVIETTAGEGGRSARIEAHPVAVQQGPRADVALAIGIDQGLAYRDMGRIVWRRQGDGWSIAWEEGEDFDRFAGLLDGARLLLVSGDGGLDGRRGVVLYWPQAAARQRVELGPGQSRRLAVQPQPSAQQRWTLDRPEAFDVRWVLTSPPQLRVEARARGAYMGPELFAELLDHYTRNLAIAQRRSTLSHRDRELLAGQYRRLRSQLDAFNECFVNEPVIALRDRYGAPVLKIELAPAEVDLPAPTGGR